MLMSNKITLEREMLNSTKWSTMGEVFSKLISPITNMILARLLIPSDFGIVASVTMIISFADVFTDAGFQKYLIQADIKEKDFGETANVAFWSNFIFSICIWIFLYWIRIPLSVSIGLTDVANILPIATISIIISSFNTIQMGIFRRNFKFKKLFLIRILGSLIPIFVTVPLAVVGFKYWSIIIGNIALSLTNALMFYFISDWKPSFSFDFNILKNMFSFSIWSLIEAISIWLTSWIDTFVISTKLESKNLGIYKTGTTTINGIMSIITGSTTPVLFSGLSKLKNDDHKFKQVFYNVQRYVAYIVLPLGVGVYTFRKFATMLFLGKGWDGADLVIGHWAITSSIMIVFGNYCSEVYRAKGKPKLSFIAQLLHLAFLIPVILIAVNINFKTLVIARAWSRLQFVLVHFIFMKKYFDISFWSVFLNVKETMISASIMGIIGVLLIRYEDSVLHQILWIFLCIIIYFILLMVQKKSRQDMRLFYQNIRKRGSRG